MSIFGPGALRRADLLADIEHRRLVALALADDDGAVELELVEGTAHRLDRGLIGSAFVAAPDQPGSRHRRRLGHPHHLQHQQAIEYVTCMHHIRDHPSILSVTPRISARRDKVENGPGETPKLNGR
jgi:hypothetical protein